MSCHVHRLLPGHLFIAAFILAGIFDHPLTEIFIPLFYIGIGLSLLAILFPQNKYLTNIEASLSFLFFFDYTITYISMAGIFIGILYHKTKNLWRLMAIHAMVDLIPNFPEFNETWGF